jgi:hypothetical protein
VRASHCHDRDRRVGRAFDPAASTRHGAAARDRGHAASGPAPRDPRVGGPRPGGRRGRCLAGAAGGPLAPRPVRRARFGPQRLSLEGLLAAAAGRGGRHPGRRGRRRMGCQPATQPHPTQSGAGRVGDRAAGHGTHTVRARTRRSGRGATLAVVSGSVGGARGPASRWAPSSHLSSRWRSSVRC